MLNASTPLIHNLVDALNSHDPAQVARYYTPDFRGMDVSLGTRYCNRQDVVMAFEQNLHAFPDLRMEAHGMLAYDNRVMFVWTLTGTQHGVFAHIPPTHKFVTACGASVLHLRDGHIHRGMRLWDLAGLLRDLGFLPELPNADGEHQSELLFAFFQDAKVC